MALTDNRTQLQDCENVNEVAGDSTADPQSNTTESGVVIEGTTALQFQVTNAQEYLAYDQDSAGNTFNLDLSDSTVYVMIKDNLHDSFANLGGQIVMDDTADGTSTTTIGLSLRLAQAELTSSSTTARKQISIRRSSNRSAMARST
jgi:hypothetical protein